MFMRHLFEDGAVVFINGQEVFRDNVAAGPLSVTTRAPAGAPGTVPISAPVPVPLTNVVPGTNVIAVVVFQTGDTSSDIFMALELTATISEFATGAPDITTEPQSQ